MSPMTDTVRVLDGSGETDEPSAKVNPGFGDKKKVVVLVLLMAVGGGIGAYQFLRAKGPSEAAAATPAALPAPAGLSPSGAAPGSIEAALNHLGATPQGAANDLLSVDRVETLVRKFDTYVQDRQVPLSGLRVNPFAVARTAAPSAAPASALPVTAPDAEVDTRRTKARGVAVRLSLGSIMIVGSRGMAVINGKLCQTGDSIEGCQVEVIEPERVVVVCEGERVELNLHANNPTPGRG